MKTFSMFLLIIASLSGSAHASADRYLDGKYINNGAAVITLPATTGTLFGKDESVALTNKTISGASNTLSNIPVGAIGGGSALSGTNTGDVTLGTANGLSLTGQELTIGTASSSTTGALTSTDWSTFNGKQAAGSYVLTSQIGAASGVASLDSGSKVPVSQLPNSIMQFLGVWNATTNSPSLADGTGTSGSVYRVNTAGTQDLGSGAQTFVVGDWVMYSGSVWQLAHAGADVVVSVNGYAGVVSLAKSDISLGNVDNVQQLPMSYLDTDNTLAANSDSKVASQKATKGYVDTAISGISNAPALSGSVGSPVAITAVGGVTFTGSNYSNIKFIVGSGGAVTVTANPQIAAGTSIGQDLTLIAEHATNTVTIADGNGLALNGAWVGGLNSVIDLVWDGAVWVEKSRR